MQVDVIDGLAAVVACVDNGAISIRQAFGACDLRSGPVQMSEELVVLFLGMRDGRNVPPRDDEHVYRRLRLQVHESIALVVLIDSFRWNTSIDDLAKKAAHSCFKVYRLMSRILQ